MDPSEITCDHLNALAHHRVALDALDRLCELAADKVARRWAGLLDTGAWPPRHPKERWWSYPAHREGERPAAARSQSLLERWSWNWQLIYDSSYLFDEGLPGVPRFGVGMTAAQGSLHGLEQNEQERLLEHDFELLARGETRSPNWDYVWRMKGVDELLTGGPLEAQAEVLANWVVRTFEALREALGSE